MGLYSHNANYTGYKKNHAEREALDYYSTPTEEVENILDTININLNHTIILEPCAGGGHMLVGIENYCNKNNFKTTIIASDVKDRGNIATTEIFSGDEFDFLTEKYPFKNTIDYIIMNPPYATIEPFTLKALEIANHGVLLLGRLQFAEGEARYDTIFKECPPTDIYVYVDRIACYKNGNVKEKQASAQAYAWFYWDRYYMQENEYPTKFHWIRRANKIK